MAVQRVEAAARAASEMDAAAIRWSVALLLLNVLDGAFTTFFLQLEVAAEANPVMRLAYESSPLTFMLAKMGLVQAGVLLLWLNRETRAARVALKGGVALYAAIVLWHFCLLAAWATG